MEVYQIEDIEIILNKEGADEFLKVSYPLRYGRFAEIKTPGYIFQFNLNGEIKFISGRAKQWPNPSEWLKRTIANDWVYYSTGGYSGVYELFGEYYLPCFSYPSNAIHLIDPFGDRAVTGAIKAWHHLREQLSQLNSFANSKTKKHFLDMVQRRSPRNLESRSAEFHKILGARITVLPPDTRHVDYEVIPIIIADGCLYQCGFCRIKSGCKFELRSRDDIMTQIQSLKAFYGPDIQNYNSIFLGQHDALNAGLEPILFTAEQAFRMFELEQSNMKRPHLFLFGSVDSLLSANPALFSQLADLPFYTYINIGFESTDRQTLSFLKKAISPLKVEMAFDKMIEINRTYDHIEITANILFDTSLPPDHLPSFFRLIEKKLDRFYPKGAIYFSPLMGIGMDKKQHIKRDFYKVKIRNRLPTFLYLIQRL